MLRCRSVAVNGGEMSRRRRASGCRLAPGRVLALCLPRGRCLAAGCFSMALSAALEKAGHPADRIETRAAVTLETVDGAPKVTRSALDVRGKVADIDEATFRQVAETAKKNCPLSKAIQGNVEITLDAKLA